MLGRAQGRQMRRRPFSGSIWGRDGRPCKPRARSWNRSRGDKPRCLPPPCPWLPVRRYHPSTDRRQLWHYFCRHTAFRDTNAWSVSCISPCPADLHPIGISAPIGGLPAQRWENNMNLDTKYILSYRIHSAPAQNRVIQTDLGRVHWQLKVSNVWVFRG